jgi:hypothetical protein
MFPPRLHVIDGGSRPSEQVEAIGPGPRYLAASPARCVQLAEAEAGRAADLLAPAIALMFKSPADIIEIAGIEEVVRARDAFREGAAAAHAVLGVLQAAEARLLLAIAAVPRDGLART